MKNLILIACILFGSSFMVSCVTIGKSAKASAKPYPLNTCLVIDRPFNKRGPKYTRVRDGQELGFCCSGCVKVFEASPDFYMDKLAKATAPVTVATGEEKGNSSSITPAE